MSSLFLFLFLFPHIGHTWGIIGHRTVGEIAESRLTAKTKKRLRELLPESLADASTWADEIRSNRKKRIEIALRWPPAALKKEKDENKLSQVTNRWHYVEIPNGQKLETVQRSEWGDIKSGIDKMISVIKDKKSPDLYKREALRLLTHYVGDVHQPLHVGNGKDRGANNCWVTWYAERYTKNIEPTPAKKTQFEKLHKVIDSTIIESVKIPATAYSQRLLSPNPRLISRDDTEVKKLESLDLKQLNKLFQNQLDDWAKQPSEVWIAESKGFRDEIYLGKTGFCFSSFTEKIDRKKIPNIGWDERYKLLRLIDMRLLQAGVRLAAVLNGSLGQ